MKITNLKSSSTPTPLLACALVFLGACWAQPEQVKAQWTTPSPPANHINNTNPGNVGIGTANPQYGKLQVNKTVRIDDDSGSANGSDTIAASANLYLGTSAGGGQLQFNGSGGIDLWQYNEVGAAP